VLSYHCLPSDQIFCQRELSDYSLATWQISSEKSMGKLFQNVLEELVMPAIHHLLHSTLRDYEELQMNNYAFSNTFRAEFHL
jgi:hypothetical protein